MEPCYSHLSRALHFSESPQTREQVKSLLSNGKLALVVDRTFARSRRSRRGVVTTFVDAQTVFDDLPEPGFPPFAYATSALCSTLCRSDTLLNVMGVRQSPSLEDLIRWIAKYAERAQGQPLPEENLTAVVKIFGLLEPHAAVIKTHRVLDNDYFFVLASDDKLMPAKHVVVDDAPWLRRRIDMSAVFTVHPRIAQVARVIGLRTLDQAVQERLHASFDPRAVLETKQETLQHLQEWQRTLRTRKFRLAVLRIAAHERQRVPGAALIRSARLQQLGANPRGHTHGNTMRDVPPCVTRAC